MSQTTGNFGWEDVFYPDFHETGIALLYRNPISTIKYDQDGKPISVSVKYKTHPSSDELGLFNQTPIAQGFTAFAHGCQLVDGTLHYRIEHNNRPNTHSLFELYLQTALMQPRKVNGRELSGQLETECDWVDGQNVALLLIRHSQSTIKIRI